MGVAAIGVLVQEPTGADGNALCEDIRADLRDHHERRTAAADGAGPLLAVIGDSYAQGRHTGAPMAAYPYVAGDVLDVPVHVDAMGGSGYVAQSPCGDAQFTSRIDDVLAEDPDVLVIAGGFNDLVHDGLEEAADAVIGRSAGSGTEVVVLSPFAPPAAEDRTERIEEMTAILERVAKSHGANFLDVSGLEFPVTGDGIHPDVEGHRIIGEVLSEALVDDVG
ncbi:hypothetical protein GCM10023169_16930 [Georgenia halophila]|uniref:SGNH hydrolase-type esterase domain-containing protein n=1 Tax=Georgenia halophila TaxID=620889 RepID=A0ABP8L456_9MICO